MITLDGGFAYRDYYSCCNEEEQKEEPQHTEVQAPCGCIVPELVDQGFHLLEFVGGHWRIKE